MDVKNAQRSGFGRVVGSGPARHGAQSWLTHQIVAVVMAPLMLYLLITFFGEVAMTHAAYTAARDWVQAPLHALALILTLSAAFYHGAGGYQMLLEDYAHHEGWRLAGLIAVKFSAAALALAGILAVVKILLAA